MLTHPPSPTFAPTPTHTHSNIHSNIHPPTHTTQTYTHSNIHPPTHTSTQTYTHSQAEFASKGKRGVTGGVQGGSFSRRPRYLCATWPPAPLTVAVNMAVKCTIQQSRKRMGENDSCCVSLANHHPLLYTYSRMQCTQSRNHALFTCLPARALSYPH
jgi:hypothetical protein